MIVSINQPAYLGTQAYWDRIRLADVHIVLDHVQFEKGSLTNRCRIRQRDGRPMWLTVPVEKGKAISETKFVGRHWVGKHIDSLTQAYQSDSRAWRKYWFDVAVPLTFDYGFSLNELLAEQRTRLLRDAFRCGTKILVSSEMGVGGVKSDLVLGLCREVGADTYLSGPHGKDYLNLPAFQAAGIEVKFHEHGDQKLELSALDDLFGGESCGSDTSRKTSAAPASTGASSPSSN